MRAAWAKGGGGSEEAGLGNPCCRWRLAVKSSLAVQGEGETQSQGEDFLLLDDVAVVVVGVLLLFVAVVVAAVAVAIAVTIAVVVVRHLQGCWRGDGVLGLAVPPTTNAALVAFVSSPLTPFSLFATGNCDLRHGAGASNVVLLRPHQSASIHSSSKAAEHLDLPACSMWISSPIRHSAPDEDGASMAPSGSAHRHS